MSLLNRNLPTWERLLRLIAAAALGLGAWMLMLTGPLRWLGLAIAAMLAATALAGFCPACAMVGRRLPGGRS